MNRESRVRRQVGRMILTSAVAGAGAVAIVAVLHSRIDCTIGRAVPDQPLAAQAEEIRRAAAAFALAKEGVDRGVPAAPGQLSRQQQATYYCEATLIQEVSARTGTGPAALARAVAPGDAKLVEWLGLADRGNPRGE